MNKKVTPVSASAYTRPELTFIGKLENLTAGGSGRKRESSASSKGKKKKSASSSRRP